MEPALRLELWILKLWVLQQFHEPPPVGHPNHWCYMAHKRSSSWQLAISRRRSSSKVKAASCSCCDKREVSPCPTSRTKAATLKSGFRNVIDEPTGHGFLRASSGWETCRLSALQSFHATSMFINPLHCKCSTCHTSTVILKLEFRWRSLGLTERWPHPRLIMPQARFMCWFFLEETVDLQHVRMRGTYALHT